MSGLLVTYNAAAEAFGIANLRLARGLHVSSLHPCLTQSLSYLPPLLPIRTASQASTHSLPVTIEVVIGMYQQPKTVYVLTDTARDTHVYMYIYMYTTSVLSA